MASLPQRSHDPAEGDGKNQWLQKIHYMLSPGTSKSKVLQIKNFLLYLFQSQSERTDSEQVVCFTPEELTYLFRCSMEEVWLSLNELEELGIEYASRSGQDPVILRDALA